MSIQRKPFGQLPTGEAVYCYTLTNHSGANVSILTYGGIIQSLNVPDKNGVLGDVVLGCSKIEYYLPNSANLGALIGRFGNRIGGASFDLNGVHYNLFPNDNGNTLHGGQFGFNQKLWHATAIDTNESEDVLILTYVSADGEENFPGELSVMVTYTFNDANELSIHYQAMTTRDTLCNLTNHSYFNLKGEGRGTILDCELQINADHFTPTDGKLIPTGEVRPVEGTWFDLRKPTPIGVCVDHMQEDEQLVTGIGFDHNFILNGEGMRVFAVAHDPATGRVMTCSTNKPCVQLYVGGQLNTMIGKCGREYTKHEGFCLETQFAPDFVHHPHFPGQILRAGESYDYSTTFAFGVK